MLARPGLLGILLRGITQRGQRLLAIQGVVVDIDLAIQRQQSALIGNDQRIDLDQAQVAFQKKFVEAEQYLGKGAYLLVGKAERECQEMLAKAREEAAKIVLASRKDLEEERKYAESALRDKTADISILAASRILGENLDSGKNRSLISKFLESVGVA